MIRKTFALLTALAAAACAQSQHIDPLLPAAGAAAGARANPHAVTFTEIAVPTLKSEPNGIAEGADGNMWFCEYAKNGIGRFDFRNGAVVRFKIPAKLTHPDQIAKGPDGNIWFTEVSSNFVGRAAKDGGITQFNYSGLAGTAGIAAGPDGNVWFTEYYQNAIASITPAGTVTSFAVPTAKGHPGYIAAGPDGALWFTEYNGDKIGRITTSGTITEFTLPTASAGPEG